MYDDSLTIVNTRLTGIYLCIILNLGNKLYNRIHTETLTLIHIFRAREFFITTLFSSQWLRIFNLDKCYTNLYDWLQHQMRKINQWLSQLAVKGGQFAVHIL